MIFENNRTYDILSIISRVVLPLSVFITSLGEIWNVPILTPIALTLGALDVFLGSILIYSKHAYDQKLEMEEANNAN